MAETIAFSNGGFDLATTSNPGTQKLDVREINPNTFALANTDGSTIKGLGIESLQQTNLTITSDKAVTLQNSTINLSDEADTLVISGRTKSSDVNTGAGDDTFNASQTLKSDTSVDLGDGNDTAKIKDKGSSFSAKDSTVNMGAGDDKLRFTGDVQRLDVDLGTGEDLLIFGGDIKNSTVNLGDDGQRDVIRIDENADFTGLKIKGAESGDILFIGSSEFQYNQSTDTWVSGDREIKF